MFVQSWPIAVVASLLAVYGTVSIAATPGFTERVIDPHAGEVVYALTPADVDGDGKQDIVAVTENAVYWYAAPDWQKRTIIKDQTVKDNVCIAAYDVDGDGKIDFALGAGWLNGRNQGTIQWLSRKESLDENWNVHFIGEIPWTHRMRWANVFGPRSASPQLIVSPLNKTEGDGVKLTAFAIPKNPKMDRWEATVLDDSLNRVHNHWHVLPKGILEHFPDAQVVPDSQVEHGRTFPSMTLTASEEGVYLIPSTESDGRGSRKIRISGGATGAKPADKGAGEVKVGTLGGQRLIATVEPMHGNTAVAYVGHGFTSSDDNDDLDIRLGIQRWQRHVLDDTLGRGHAVWLADLNGDGNDEIVVGHSEPATAEIKGPGVYFYQAEDDAGTKWTKHVVDDGGMATEDLFAIDMTGDGRPDIVAGGRDTHNVKLYVNSGK